MYPPMDIPEPLSATEGGDNVPATGGTPLPAPAVSLPSVAAGVPPPAAAPPMAPDAALATLKARLAGLNTPAAPSGTERFVQAMRVAAPALAALFASRSSQPGAALGGFARSWDAGDLQRERERARVQERKDLHAEQIARAIKDLEAENVAQARINAQVRKEQQTKAEQDRKDRMTELRQGFDRANAKGAFVDQINAMIDEHADEGGLNSPAVQQYLSTPMAGFSQPTTVKDVIHFAPTDPKGEHFINGQVKAPKEYDLGSKADVVQRALKIATQGNKGQPLTDQMTQAVTTKAVHEYDQLPKDPTMEALKQMQLNVMIGIHELQKQQLEANMEPRARAVRKLGTEANRIADMDSGIQEAERLRTMFKATGLDQDNNPIGPKLDQLLVKMGVDPGHLPADLVQSAGYINAKLFMALGRGNAGRSMIMYQQLGSHLPRPGVSGKETSDVLDAILREYQNQRHNSLRVKGVADEEYPFEHTMANPVKSLYVGQEVPLAGGGRGHIIGFDKNGEPQIQ